MRKDHITYTQQIRTPKTHILFNILRSSSATSIMCSVCPFTACIYFLVLLLANLSILSNALCMCVCVRRTLFVCVCECLTNHPFLVRRRQLFFPIGV